MKSKFGIFGIAGRAVLVVALAGLALACSRQKLSFDDLRQRYMDQATGGASVDLTDSIILETLRRAGRGRAEGVGDDEQGRRPHLPSGTTAVVSTTASRRGVPPR
ncbi:MAG: hypothetical protein ACLR8Y_08310 [Alistipes indistinctus]